MQKNKLMQIILTIVFTGMMAGMTGCGSSQDAINGQEQQETAITVTDTEQMQEQPEETDSEETQIQIEMESDTETELQTETNSELGTQAEIESETEQQAKASTETEPQTERMLEVQSSPEIQPPVEEGSVSESDYMVSVRGTAIALQGDMCDYTGALGNPDGYSAAKSCMEAGEDKIYTYGGITIYTYITNGVDRITLIEITGSEALPSGIHIGSTRAEVIAAYGNGYTEEGTELLYEMGGKMLGLQIENDMVSFMELFGR